MKAKKVVRRRRVSKKPLAKKTINAVKRIVNKAINKNIETKFIPYSASGQLNNYGSCLSWNLFYHGIDQGNTNNTIIGDKIEWRGIAIKYVITNRYLDTTYVYNSQPVVVDLLLLETDTLKTSTSLVISDLSSSTTNDANTFFMDPATKVLMKKTVRIYPDRGSATVQQRQVNGKLWLKRKQILQFTDFGKYDYKLAKNKYYYFMAIHKSISNEKCSIDFTWQNYFKDA